MMTVDSPAAHRRTVALFPGAFRPPHLNHYETVRRLAERTDVDEVVIIISNRARPVPGTRLVLDVDLAVGVWEVYLRHHPNARVEVAPAGGVRHALDLVDDAAPGERRLLRTPPRLPGVLALPSAMRFAVGLAFDV